MKTVRMIFGVIAFVLSAVSYGQSEGLNRAMAMLGEGKSAEAAKLFQSLAETGNAAAQYQLGLLFYTGKGVKESEKLAVDWLVKSARQGNVDAMYQLGNAFTFGNDTPRLVADADMEAAQWYYKAAKAGNADAQYSLGLLFMAGKGVEKNEKEATYWMQLAAKNGHKDAGNYVQSNNRR